MHAQLLRMAADLSQREEPFVLALVVRRRPASSAQAGDMALITADGEFHGWLGGSCIQPTVIREARRALEEGKPRLLALSPDPETERRPGVAVFPMTCHSGGSVEIYLEPIQPAPHLAVFGTSPTARALARLAAAMGYTVTVVEDAEGVPPAAGGEPGGAGGMAVVATMGEGDEAAIRAALALKPSYLGVVASARRFAQMRQVLLEEGVSEAALAEIKSPAGLSIGAQTPDEIAVSVLAEIVQKRRAADGEEAKRAGAAVAGVAPAGEAADPICGMSVATSGARHTAEYAGRIYYFCCAGCRARFLAAPAEHAAAGGAA